MDIPKGCQECRVFRKHMFGNGIDYSYSCDLGATDFPMPWIRQLEERATDCPLEEIVILRKENKKLEDIKQIFNDYGINLKALEEEDLTDFERDIIREVLEDEQ